MKKKLPSVATATENKIESCANAIQVFFIIMGVLIFIGGVTMYGTLGMFGVFIGIVYCVGCILCGVALWAVLKGLATISVTLKHLRNIQDPTAFAPSVRERAKSLVPVADRKPLNKAYLTTSNEAEMDGLQVGMPVQILSTGDSGVIRYFTEEGHVVVRLSDGQTEGAFYIDDVEHRKTMNEMTIQEIAAEIKQRPRLELEKQTTNTKTQEKGFSQGEEVIVCSLGCTAIIQYFTDEGNVIVKTSHGSVALYFDDIMKL